MRSKSSQLFGLALWAPVLGGGLFFMIGDPGLRFLREQVGLQAPEKAPGEE